MRHRRGWRQVDLASRCGISQSEISRIELGLIDAVPIGKIERVVSVLGGSLDARVRWNGEGIDRLLDAAHAAAVEATVLLLQRSGWLAAPEVTFAVRGERGSIDVLAWRVAGDLLVVEVKSVVPDLQSMLASLDRKVRLAPLIARDRGITGTTRVSRLLVIAESSTNRRRVESHQAMLVAALPERGRVVTSWLRDPGRGRRSGMAGLVFLAPTQPAGVRRQQRVRPRR